MNKEPKEKTIVYDTPKTKVIPRRQDFYRKVNFDPQHIVDLIQEYPNDKELGREIRSYYLSLTND